MVSMSTGDSSLPLMKARVNQIRPWHRGWGIITRLKKNASRLSCRQTNCSVSHCWLINSCWIDDDDLLVLVGWLGSTSPLILLLLVSSSPDSSDSPLRSTAVSSRQKREEKKKKRRRCLISPWGCRVVVSGTFSWCTCNMMRRDYSRPSSTFMFTEESGWMSCGASCTRLWTVTLHYTHRSFQHRCCISHLTRWQPAHELRLAFWH